MKNKSLVFNTLFVSVVAFATLFFNSCSKEESDQPQQVNIDEEFGKYTKEVTVYDENKENSAVLLVGSDDESILNMWTSENFTLLPIKEGESIEDALGLEFSEEAGDELDESLSKLDDSEDVAAKISTRFLSKNLQNGVTGVLLLSTDPYDDDMRGWKYDTHYSEYYGQPNSQNQGIVTYNVWGYNFWHRGYYGMFMLVTSSSTNWSTIISEWKQIKKNEHHSDSKACYVMKGTRKYKSNNNNSVIIGFTY